ncbi:[Fe-Fe] hydrogenase large subunit C-terminal domain-containing protein [Clostridium hydrogeniformans]|uniref:[Fe-Fe] hydrogenase large subunit C-terminal domain-containing protein n=1 Tax=Clostridium hydrogeniformans TaxID=349933 RepID=UPI000488DC83|nr:[Fe-Fe] hydrogenase large subunit C-terminal domain-containing protein [Clostridium hydrogeniformans]
MNTQYTNIFKTLVKAYYEDNFEEKIEELMKKEEVDKKTLSEVISSLCGVKVDYSERFSSDLKKAITTYKAKGKIVSKLSHCDNCTDGACINACPFNAILKDPITKLSYIDMELCTNCGLCVEACDLGHIVDKVEFMPLMELLKSGETVIAAVAPAITGQFGEDVTMDQIREAFMKLGFKDMVEVAFFADMLTIKESVEFNRFVKSKEDLMITSCCCPMWVGMLKRVYGNLVKYVSPSVSPMIAAARVIKKLNPNCRVVFIGPCIAKKAEAKEKDLIGDVDFVLTFQELQEIFNTLEISPSNLKGVPSLEYASKGGRLYARTGGVSVAVSDAIKEMYPEKYNLFEAAQCDGVINCKKLLSSAQDGELKANFIEGMGCVGGCVGGPKAIIPKEEGKKHVDDYAFDSAYKVATHSDIMLDILKRIGINSLEDFKDHNKIKIFEREF